MKVSFIRPIGALPQTPAPVQNVVATVISSTEIDLTWTAIAGAQNYTVRIFGNPVITLLATAARFTTLAPSTLYSFTVAAINSIGEGLQSTPVTATTQTAVTVPAAVASLTATPISQTEIDLAWPSALGATTYIVSRNSSPIASPAATTYADTGLTAGTFYTYSVAGHNTAGTGGAATATATTKTSAQINWNPGHYFQVGGVDSFHGVSDATGNMDLVAGMDVGHVVLGFEVVFTWAQLESTAGVYPGIALVQQLLTHVQAMTPPRTLQIAINSTGNVNGGGIPSDMVNNTTYGPVDSSGNQGGQYLDSSGGRVTRFWNANTAARMANLAKVFYNQFGTQIFRWSPLYSELSTALPSNAGYTSASFTANALNIFGPMRSNAPKWLIVIPPTYLAQSDYPQLYNNICFPNKISIGNYDSCHETPTIGASGRAFTGDTAFRGGFYVNNVFTPYAGLSDQRGIQDFHTNTGFDELGQRTGTNVVPPATIGDGNLPNIWSHDIQQQTSHKVWMCNRQTGPLCNSVTTITGAPANYAGANWGNLVGFVQTVKVPTTAYPKGWL